MSTGETTKQRWYRKSQLLCFSKIQRIDFEKEEKEQRSEKCINIIVFF